MPDVTIVNQPADAELEALGVRNWPIWEKEASTFPWHYDAEEKCYLLEGRVTVTTDAGESFEFGAGDLVTFAQGLSCQWQIHQAVKKHYQFN